MSRSALTAVVVAAMMLLAGCNLLGADSSMTTPRVTPAEVPTTSPTVTPPEQLAPGLMPYGVTNASALVNAHTALLTNTSFTVHSSWILTSPNGTVVARTTETKRVEGDSMYIVRTTSGLDYSPYRDRHEEWYGENWVLTKTLATNSTKYKRQPRSGLVHAEAIPEPRTEFYQAFEPWTNPRIERSRVNGTTLYRLTTTYRNQPSNITISALIDSRGIIHRFTSREPITYPPAPNASHSIKSFHITDIGTTTVDRPAWYAEAVTQTTPGTRTTATATTTD